MSRQLQLKMTGVARLRMNEPGHRFSVYENDTWHATTEETYGNRLSVLKFNQCGTEMFLQVHKTFHTVLLFCYTGQNRIIAALHVDDQGLSKWTTEDWPLRAAWPAPWEQHASSVIGIPSTEFTMLYRDIPNSDTDLIRIKPTRIVFTIQCLDVDMRTRHGTNQRWHQTPTIGQFKVQSAISTPRTVCPSPALTSASQRLSDIRKQATPEVSTQLAIPRVAYRTPITTPANKATESPIEPTLDALEPSLGPNETIESIEINSGATGTDSTVTDVPNSEKGPVIDIGPTISHDKDESFSVEPSEEVSWPNYPESSDSD